MSAPTGDTDRLTDWFGRGPKLQRMKANPGAGRGHTVEHDRNHWCTGWGNWGCEPVVSKEVTNG